MPTTSDHNPESPLACIHTPHSVALIGATDREGSVGATILHNLIQTPFGGTIYPVNPKRSEIMGLKAYPSVGAVPRPLDLAVIVTPAPSVPAIIADCVAAGVRGAIIISAGFRENGAAGRELEDQIAKIAYGKIRIVGPNCLGVMNPIGGLNATFAAGMALRGSVGFISQSGALCTAILDWSLKENVGFSAFISAGAMLDVGWGDLIYHLGDDPNTKSIVIYMEAIGDARSFLSAAREIAMSKPIIVIKAGRTAQAAKAAASHTGALAGSDDVLDAAFRRCGVLRVESIAELFGMAELLAKQPRPRGPRLTILTNAGGPGVLATDALVSSGGELAKLSPETLSSLDAILPPHWSHGNPVDVLGDAGPDRYASAFAAAASDPNSDGMLLVLTPQGMTDPTEVARQLCAVPRPTDKPILASWMGGTSVEPGSAIFKKAGIPVFSYPDSAAKRFQRMWQYSANLDRLYETPEDTSSSGNASGASQSAEQFIRQIRDTGRTLLTETESKQLLSLYEIPTVPTQIALNADDAARLATRFGFPAVLKLHSESITHKTDVGGVKLNLRDAAQVHRAFAEIETSVHEIAGAGHFQGVTVQPMIPLDGYELILGSSIDEQFGPVIMAGTGGQLVEVYKDRSLALPPLTTTLARQMLERTKVHTALLGVRGRAPVDLAALDNLIVRFSQLVSEHPSIKEIDINPLLVSPERILALDARVVLHDKSIPDAKLPRTAIRPYPSKYASSCTLKDGISVTIRPIRPDDEPLMIDFHAGLSESTVQLRYLYSIPLEQRINHRRLVRACFVDYDRDMALVAEYIKPDGVKAILGVARLTKLHGVSAGKVYIVVSDRWHGLGLGREILTRLMQFARGEALELLYAEAPAAARNAVHLLEHAGFKFAPGETSETLMGQCELKY